jgi:pantoate--beta-alanine ligase
MEVVRTICETRRAVLAARRAGRRIGFVPTMGALHEGHLSLVRAARRESGYVVVSIFVNPTQFAPHEDFERYPRDEAGDLRKCAAAGVDLLFAPAVQEMYPPDAVTTVRVARLTEHLCGPHRPGHFEGVATIVAKLFNIVQPDVAFFGQKDAQQLAVIRRMVRDLDIPVEVVGCPTVREPDGLALSSRNAYLSHEERARAACLHEALQEARRRIQRGERDVHSLITAMRQVLLTAAPERIDYIELVDPQTLQPLERIEGPVLAALAVYIGRTRLIDNLTIDPRGGSD